MKSQNDLSWKGSLRPPRPTPLPWAGIFSTKPTHLALSTSRAGKRFHLLCIYLKMTKTWEPQAIKPPLGRSRGNTAECSAWRNGQQQLLRRKHRNSKPRKSLPVLSLPSCLSAVYGFSEPKARALGINPSSKNLSNLFGTIYTLTSSVSCGKACHSPVMLL